MDRRTAVAVAFVAAGLALMGAVSRGRVDEPALGDPAWWLVGVVVVGYWVAFVRWARTREPGAGEGA